MERFSSTINCTLNFRCVNRVPTNKKRVFVVLRSMLRSNRYAAEISALLFAKRQFLFPRPPFYFRFALLRVAAPGRLFGVHDFVCLFSSGVAPAVARLVLCEATLKVIGDAGVERTVLAPKDVDVVHDD